MSACGNQPDRDQDERAANILYRFQSDSEEDIGSNSCYDRLEGDGALHAEARGAVEGIGSAPRIAITDGDDKSLLKRDLNPSEVRDPSDAVRERSHTG